MQGFIFNIGYNPIAGVKPNNSSVLVKELNPRFRGFFVCNLFSCYLPFIISL